MPSKVFTPIEQPATVIVTGANGFIAQHCIAFLLGDGYRVVGTVRSDKKREIVIQTHNRHRKLEIVTVDDITDADTLLHLLHPFSPSAILHLASPFHYNGTNYEKDFMIPAVAGTLAVLEVASAIKSVRRFVHTNSFASIYDAAAGPCPEKTYTAHDWSPLTYDDGVHAPNAPTAYRASKTVAERVAWQFMEDNRPAFDLVSLCPAMVFGPFMPSAVPRSAEEVNTSNLMVWGVVSAGSANLVPPTKGPVWVDVRDVAEAHVKSLKIPEAGGGRFLLANGVYCNQEIADVAREALPKYSDRIPLGDLGKRESHTHFGVDASETEAVLRIKWRSLRHCLSDLVPQLFEIESSN
jgi:nucleoside-diphosphate-sugar epimerase